MVTGTNSDFASSSPAPHNAELPILHSRTPIRAAATNTASTSNRKLRSRPSRSGMPNCHCNKKATDDNNTIVNTYIANSRSASAVMMRIMVSPPR